jgi:hypothetical protein
VTPAEHSGLLRTIAAELRHHLTNGSDWLVFDDDGEQREDYAERADVIEREALRLERKAKRVARKAQP